LGTAGATVAGSATVVSPICAAADLRLITLIEAHGEAQLAACKLRLELGGLPDINEPIPPTHAS
jgi:hypothetical protein